MILDDDIVWNDNCAYIKYEDYLSTHTRPQDLNLLQLNIRGLINKQSELNTLLQRERTNKVDVALLCETWIRAENRSRINIPGYQIESKERKGKKGGGVAILVKDNIKYRRRCDLEVDSKHLECVVVEIRDNVENVLLASCYRAPNMYQKEFLESYKKLLQDLKKNSANLIIGIDHNMDLLQSSLQGLTHEFFELNIINGVNPCITKPMRITHSTATLIDNIFCSQSMYRNSTSGIIIDDISDHLPCQCTIQSFNLTQIEDEIMYKRSINEKTITLLKGKLKEMNWSDITKIEDVDIQFKTFHQLLIEKLDKAMPYKATKFKTKKTHEPWITKSIQCSMLKLKKILQRHTKYYSTQCYHW